MTNEKKPWVRTPLVESANLSKAAGCRILLKLDNLQPSGSFKLRGIGHHLLSALKRSSNPEKVHFYSSSGGNAGLACVHAANFLGRPSTVAVPLSTKPFMMAKIRAAGASEVVQYGRTWKEADTYLKDVVIRNAESNGEEGVYVHPFDDPEIWDGHGTLVDEVEQQLEGMGEGKAGPDVMVCSVGGGGLFNGVMQSVEAKKHWKTTVLALETRGADSLAQALDKNELVTLPGITSLATSLGATRVSERTFELVQKHRASGKVKNAVLDDAEAAMGCWRFADDERMLVELACGVNVAVCYGGRLEKALGRPVRKDEKVVIVVCGGQNVTTSMIEGWRKEFGDLDSDLSNAPQMSDVPSAATASNGI
ncbi:hypothetical protein LTR36_009655 [Oleoguttula mirabilis]|uniref:L-serine ammonia-lyase n=1 Tax=Oleoguttula mirabilis TaxID=1507867 RepID=A0AAV9J6C3_9PEZI|nr:hypothetical protein LTR36_009655 [Oleoguttula mirabilis]